MKNLRLKDIDKLIEVSIKVNRNMLDILSQSNSLIVDYENEFLDILKSQDKNKFYKDLAIKISEDLSDENNKLVFSDLIHLFEFEKVTIKGYKTKIIQCLENRRRIKMLVGYANRVQQERGFTNSIYWYNRHYNDSINSYALKTNINDEFVKDMRISKKSS